MQPVDTWTDEEINLVLERYDQTHPLLQRRIIMRLLERISQLEDEVKRLEGDLRHDESM